MYTTWSISGPDGRLPQRSHAVKPTVARAAPGAKKLLTLRVPVASQAIDHAEMPVARAVVLEHGLPTTRAELSPTFNPNPFRHSPGFTPLGRNSDFVFLSRQDHTPAAVPAQAPITVASWGWRRSSFGLFRIPAIPCVTPHWQPSRWTRLGLLGLDELRLVVSTFGRPP
jgi:hypothetical protein